MEAEAFSAVVYTGTNSGQMISEAISIRILFVAGSCHSLVSNVRPQLPCPVVFLESLEK